MRCDVPKLRRYKSLECKFCQRTMLDSLRAGYVVKFQPDALGNLVEHLNSQKQSKNVQWVDPEEVVQEFTSLSGRKVSFNHETGEVSGIDDRQQVDWSTWHRVVDAREQAEGRPPPAWQCASDCGNGKLDLGPVEAWTAAALGDFLEDSGQHVPEAAEKVELVQLVRDIVSKRPARSQPSSLKLEAHRVKKRLWEEMLLSGCQQKDLTDGKEFDWRAYLLGLGEEGQQLVCRGDVDTIRRFCGELHLTATCPWTHRPAFHFVAYDRSGLRVLIRQGGDGRYTVFFESADRRFLALQCRPPDSETVLGPTPSARDICEAFGGRSFDGRRLKCLLLGDSAGTFRDWVIQFLREREAVISRNGKLQRMITSVKTGIGGKPAGPVGNGTALSASHPDIAHSQSNMDFCFYM